MTIKELLSHYHKVEVDRYLPFSEYTSEKIFESFSKPLLAVLEWNPDDIKPNPEEEKSYFLVPKVGKKIVFYVASLQELESLRLFRSYAKSHSIDDEIAISFVTTFASTYIYYRGKEVLAFGTKQLDERFDDLTKALSKTSIETGKFAEYLNIYLAKDYDEELFRELNLLRIKLAEDLVVKKRRENISTLTVDGRWDIEKINEIVVRIITRFLALRNAEDRLLIPIKGKGPNLSDIKRGFDEKGNLIKEKGISYFRDTLFNTLKRFLWDFDIEYNGGIFLWDEGTEGVMLSPLVFHQLLDFCASWCFPEEHDRLIGATYERFLGQEIVVEEKRGKTQVKLLPIGEARGQRKAGGIYYTPPYIVNYIVENTLGEILQEKRKEIERTVNSLNLKSFCETLKMVKSLKTLDPACGSGSFLIKLLQEFKSFYEEIKEKAKNLEDKVQAIKRKKGLTETLFHEDKEVLELEHILLEIKKEIEELKYSGIYALKHNIYGVDLDPKAVTISAFTLMLQIYDELKDGAKCPALIDENLKIGNSLISSVTNQRKNGFFTRKEIEKKFKQELKEIIAARLKEKHVDDLSTQETEKLIEEKYLRIAEYLPILKDRYPNALPPELLKLLEDWSKKAEKEGKEKAVDLLVYQTKLAPLFLKFLLLEETKQVIYKINQKINIPLIKYFNSKKTALEEKELEEVIKDEILLLEELKYLDERSLDISKSQPPKAFNWEVEFPETFFSEDGTLKENAGFDVIVGNPPYIPDLGEHEPAFTEFSNLLRGIEIDIYHTVPHFIYISHDILNKNGLFSMIIPNGIARSNSFKKTRNFLLDKIELTEIIDEGNPFKEAGVVLEMITIKYRNICPTSDHVKIISRRPHTTFEEDVKKALWKKTNRFLFYIDKFWGKLNQGALNCVFTSGNMVIGSEFLKSSPSKNSVGVITGRGTERYGIRINNLEWVDKTYLFTNKPRHYNLLNKEILVQTLHINEYRIALKPKGYTLGESSVIIYNEAEEKISNDVLMAILNSSLMRYVVKKYIFSFSELTFDLTSPSTKLTPIKIPTPGQKDIMENLIDAITTKKKDYYSINQNIGGYVDFKKAKQIYFQDFLKKALLGFEPLSSVKIKYDNFDSLRIRFENNQAIPEYGLKKRIEEIIAEDEDSTEETQGLRERHIIEWLEAGRGEIKNLMALEFLQSYLTTLKNFSRATRKSIWQKILEIKVPEFNKETKEGYKRFQQAISKARALDKEITKIDRSIDRLVYNLYGLTEDEIRAVEKSIWAEEFESMYNLLPDKEIDNIPSKRYEGETQ